MNKYHISFQILTAPDQKCHYVHMMNLHTYNTYTYILSYLLTYSVSLVVRRTRLSSSTIVNRAFRSPLPDCGTLCRRTSL